MTLTPLGSFRFLGEHFVLHIDIIGPLPHCEGFCCLTLRVNHCVEAVRVILRHVRR